MMLIRIFLIIALSPIEHPNKQILDKERKIYKLIATVLSVTISSISFLLVFKELYIEVGYALSTGLMTSSLLMIAGKFKLSKKIKEEKRKLL
jgi:multidrug transporter EmrE-like cation transporter